MQKKLTLRMEKSLIDYAKAHARKRGTSVSKLVADYFEGMAKLEKGEQNEDADDFEDLPPVTRSLIGIASASEATEEDYYRHLEEKYQ